MAVAHAGEATRVTLYGPADGGGHRVLSERARIEYRSGVTLVVITGATDQSLAAILDKRADMALVALRPNEVPGDLGGPDPSSSTPRLNAFALAPGISVVTLGDPSPRMRAVIEAVQSILTEPNMAERE